MAAPKKKSSPLSLPLHSLPPLLLALPLQKPPLFLGVHSPQLLLPLRLLLFGAFGLALFGLLILGLSLQLPNFVLAEHLDFTDDFGAEVGSGDEVVGESDESLEEVGKRGRGA